MKSNITQYIIQIGIIGIGLAHTIPSQAVAPPTTINLWSPEYLAQQHTLPLPVEEQSTKGAISHVAVPRILVYRPTQSNHKAIMVISGGGYRREELGKEGTPASEWLVNQGYTVFNLIYRLPMDGWHNKMVPFADGQRALRIIRQKANVYDYNQVGVMGFSAGGHLAGMLAVSAGHNFYPYQDIIDNNSARPDFAALLYPVVSMVSDGHRTQSYKQLLGNNATDSQKQALSIERQVNKDTPPMFIAHAKDDPIASVNDSIALDEQLKKQGIKQLLTLFNEGGHGWGMGKAGTATTTWPALFKQWADSLKR